MDVSVETLRKTIGAATDEELLRRWGEKLFTDDALPVAEAELVKRGLDFSPANIERVQTERTVEVREARSIRYVKLLTSVIVAAGCAGFASRLGFIGVLIGGAITWPLGTWLSKTIDRRVDVTWVRFALGLVAFILALLASLIGSLLIGAALEPRATSASTPLTEPSAQVAPVRPLQPVLTEHDLRTVAQAQNKTLPIKTSANLELTRIDPGPGMKLTYQVRVLAEGITKDSISAADIANIRDEAIKEACAGFRAGLESGVTYVMAYNATDGTNLFSFPIVIADC